MAESTGVITSNVNWDIITNGIKNLMQSNPVAFWLSVGTILCLVIAAIGLAYAWIVYSSRNN